MAGQCKYSYETRNRPHYQRCTVRRDAEYHDRSWTRYILAPDGWHGYRTDLLTFYHSHYRHAGSHQKYVDDSVAGAGGGDVTAAGNNAFTGLNTFANETTFGNELNVWDSLTSRSSTGQINIGRVSGANGAYITGESGGGLALHTKKGSRLNCWTA